MIWTQVYLSVVSVEPGEQHFNDLSRSHVYDADGFHSGCPIAIRSFQGYPHLHTHTID